VLADGDGTAAVLPLVGPAVHVVALAPDARTLRRLLEAAAPAPGPEKVH
jgi:urease accessory protein